MDIQSAAKKFTHFWQAQAESSPMYRELGSRIAVDPKVLQVAAVAPESQPLPHLLLGVVQFLLKQESGGIEADDDVESAYRVLREVVLGRKQEVEELLRTRIVQTNEVRRSIFLFTSFVRLCREYPDRSIALIEIGASAGLNLLFDSYRYRFGDAPDFGNVDSEVFVKAALRGEGRPKTQTPPNPIVTRIGLDLSPVNVENEDDVDWLRALIWPEHKDRLELLEKAIVARKQIRVQTVQGNGIALLPSLAEGISPEVVPLVFHTYTANQFSEPEKNSLLETIDRIGAGRDVIHLHNNMEPHLHATLYQRGKRMDLPLAQTEVHARWVEWLDRS